MNHTVRLFDGIFKPGREFAKLAVSRKTKGLKWRFVLMMLVNSICTMFFYHANTNGEKAFLGFHVSGHFAGRMIAAFIGGLFEPFFFVLVLAFIYWMFFSDSGFRKIFVIQTYVYVIILINSIVTVLFMLAAHTIAGVSPLSLGMLFSAGRPGSLLREISNNLSIFTVWIAVVQIIAFRKISTKSLSYIIAVVIILNIIGLIV